MQFPILLLVVVPLSCSSLSQPPVGTAAAAAAVQDELPAAREGLALPEFDAGDVSLADFLREFARITDQHLVMSERTKSAMQQTPVVVGAVSEIPPGEVYAFVEGLLVFHGFYTAQLKGGERPLLGVYAQQEAGLAPRKSIKAADLPKYAGHPAFLVQTVLELDSLDTRQLSTSLRAMLRDTNTQMMLAVGDRGIALGGTGQFVADLAQLVNETNAQARASREERVQVEIEEGPAEGEKND